MALRTASVTGNWNNTATWGGAAVPGNGDHVVINNGITLTVPVGYTAVVGEAGNPAIDVQGTSGTGVLVVNGTLQIKSGDVLCGNAGWTIAAGAVVEYDNAADAVWQIAKDHVQASAHLTINGTSGSHATIRSTTAGGEMRFSDGGFLRGGLITATWADFLRVGNASSNAVSFWPSSGGDTFSLTDCSFDACGRIATTSQIESGTTVLLRRVRFLNSPGTECLELQGGNPVGVGTRELDSCSFDKSFSWAVKDLTIKECRFFGGLSAVTTADGTTAATFHDNFLYSTATALATLLPQGVCKDVYCVVNTASNPHFLQLSPSAGTKEIDGAVLECPNTATDGDGIIGADAASQSVHHVLLLPNVNNDSPGKVVSLLGGTNTAIAVEHCTYVTTGASETGVGVAETYAGHANMITSLKSNLPWRPAGKSGGYKMRRVGGGTVQDIVAAANANYNGNWNLAAGSDGNGYDGGGTNLFSSGTPDANGVSGDPQFVAPTRNLASWDASLGGAGTVAAAVARLQALTGTVASLLAYVRAGFAPQAAIYNAAAHDGATVGAVAYSAPAGGGGSTAYYAALNRGNVSMHLIKQSEGTAARRRLYFQIVDSVDGITAKTGLTGTGRVSKNGGATNASSGSLVEIDATNMPGRYYVELTAAEVDTLGHVEYRYKTGTCAEVVARAMVVAYDPYPAGPTVSEIQTGLATAAALTTSDGKLDTLLAADTTYKKGVAVTAFMFYMQLTSGAPGTGLTVAATISKDGGAFNAIAGAVTEVSAGWYKVNLTNTEMTADEVALKFTATGANQRNIKIRTQS
jgi:hypothetical protein